MDRITLHEELLAILTANGNRWMSDAELARAVNTRGRYHKRDGSLVEPGQIRLRTRSGGGYGHLFERNGSLVRRRIRPSTAQPTKRASAAPAPPRTLSDIEVAAVIDALEAPMSLDEARQTVPDRPGLYAVHGPSEVWVDLGLGEPPDDRPLYVGKAEGSIASRDLRQHFQSGRTGSSTLRRSLAALLAESNGLHAIPRNPRKPGQFANYGLESASDDWLTDWMALRLTLAVWVAGTGVVLRPIEQTVLRRLQPPLNLEGVVTRWSAQVSAARRKLAEEARRWSG